MSLISRINNPYYSGGRSKFSGIDGNLRIPPMEQRIKKQRPDNDIKAALNDAPYLIQSLDKPPGLEPSLYFRLLAMHKLPTDPVFPQQKITEDLSGERVLEKLPLTFKERQAAVVVSALKKLADNVDSLRGPIGTLLGEALNAPLTDEQKELINTLSKDDQKTFLDDVQRLVLKDKYEDKVSINKLLNSISEGVYHRPEPEEKSEIDKFIADEPPGDEGEEVDYADLSKPLPGEPDYKEEEEEKKHDVPEPLSRIERAVLRLRSPLRPAGSGEITDDPYGDLIGRDEDGELLPGFYEYVDNRANREWPGGSRVGEIYRR